MTAASGTETPSGPTEPPLPANADNRQLARNFLTSYLGFGAACLMGLFLTPVVLRRLGPEDYGLWIVISTLGGYLAIIGAGVETAAVREIAACIASGDMCRLREVVATARAFFLASGSTAGFLIIAIVPFVGQLFGVSHQLLGAARLSLALTAVVTSFAMLQNIPQTVLVGAGRNDMSNIIGLILGIASQGGQIAAVLLGAGYMSLFAVSALQIVVGYLVLGRVVRRSALLPPGRSRPTKAMLRELLRSGRRNVTVSICGTIAYSLDAVIIGIVLPVARVAPYDLGYTTATFVRGAAVSGTNMLMPTYAHSATVDDRERQFRLWSRSVLLSLAITVPMLIALIVFGKMLLRLWVGDVPPDTYWAMIALNVVFLIQLPGHQAFLFLTGAGRNRLLARLALAPALANFALSVLATLWLGPVGPAIGSIPQVVIMDFIVLPVLCCRHLGQPIRRFLSEALAPVLVPAIGAIAIAFGLLGLLGNHSTLLAPIESVVVCLGAWCGLLLVLSRYDPVVRGALSHFRLQKAAL